MTKKRVLLVTGASGFLGQHICRLAASEWNVVGVFNAHAFGRPGVTAVQADITQDREVETLFERVRPHVVIHAAALSNINACQREPEVSRKINVEGSRNVARWCGRFSVPCAFTSTDMVFDGLNAPYKEDDPANPINVYGAHKKEAEAILEEHGSPEVLICRLALLYGSSAGPTGSFLQSLVNALREGRALKLFGDEFRTPLFVEDAVRALLAFAGRTSGVLHLGGPERISRYDLGLRVCRVLGEGSSSIHFALQQEVKMPAPRPRDLSLDSSRALALGFIQTPLEESLHTIFRGRQ